LKDIKTGVTKETSSNSGGTFLFPDLAAGMYEIIVTAPSFQTARLTDITVSTSQTTDLRVSMTLGQTSETVTVAAVDAAALETSSQLVASTITTQMINPLPLGDRSGALALARLAPGAMPPSSGSTRYNNLAGGAVNVTVDGINNASNGFKSGGTVFFATVPVRLGALEEVTVETGGLGADSGASNSPPSAAANSTTAASSTSRAANSSMPIPGLETPRTNHGSILVFTILEEISAGR
jgi:hypothetical protein